MNKKFEKLMDSVPENIKDFVELRLQSHTESSLKVVAPILEQLKTLTRLIEAHDKVLTSENMDTLLEMIKQAQDAKIIQKNYELQIKKGVKITGFIVAVATFLTAVRYIFNSIIAHIK